MKLRFWLVMFSSACLAFAPLAAALGQESGDLSRALRVVPADKIQSSPSSEWYVFLVSSKDYRDGLGDLSHTDADVEDLETVFLNLGVPETNIVVMRKNDANYNKVPTKENIEEQFTKFVDRLPANSVAFCLFSGHGFSYKEPGESESRTYYAPIDARLKRTVKEDGVLKELSGVDLLLSTSVSIDDLLAELSASRAQFKWFNVDACRTYVGRDVAVKSATNDLNVENIPPGVLFFQSCGDGQVSFEYVNDKVTRAKGGSTDDYMLHHGLFTKSLIAALNITLARREDGTISATRYSDVEKKTVADAGTEDAPKDGMITLRELVAYVQKQVDADAREYHNRSQNPQMRVNGEVGLDDFALFTGLPVEGYDYDVWQEGQNALAEALSLKEKGDFEGAHEAAVKAREKLPTVSKVVDEANAIQAQFDSIVAERNYEAAQKDFQEERYDSALEKIKKALNPTPQDSDKKTAYEKLRKDIEKKIADKAYNYAEESYNYQNYQIAYDAIEKARKLFPDEKKYKELRDKIRGGALDAGVTLKEQRVQDSGTKPEPPVVVTKPAPPKPQSSSGGGSSSSPNTSSTSTSNTSVSGEQAGDLKTIKIAGVATNFRWCPPGEFQMGSPSYEKGRNSDETQHTVKLTKGFWLAETETTQALWKAVMGDNPSHFKGDSLPVEEVSWNDCQEFIKKIQRYAPSGMRFKLPSEAHWEYACRAGTWTRYSWGDEWDSDKANADHFWSGKTGPAGGLSYKNAWNLKDMIGNVCEWCDDWYGDYPSGTVTDPTGPQNGSYRVLRGGGWFDGPWNCRSARRYRFTPSFRGYNLGFRLEAEVVSSK